MKSKLILLDAVIVIDLFELGYWNQIIQNYEIYLPSSVANLEANYYKDAYGTQISIELEHYLKNNQIKILTADNTHITNLESIFDSEFKLDLGEKEALALMLTNDGSSQIFCTSDATAIYALAMLNMRNRGISLEELLNSIGIQSNKLERQHKKRFFNECLQKGFEKRLRGEGLAVDSPYRI